MPLAPEPIGYSGEREALQNPPHYNAAECLMSPKILVEASTMSTKTRLPEGHSQLPEKEPAKVMFLTAGEFELWNTPRPLPVKRRDRRLTGLSEALSLCEIACKASARHVNDLLTKGQRNDTLW